MKLTDEQKCAIEAEYKEWEALQYSGKTKKERQKMSQFFTPPPLTIKMLEKFDTVKDKDILDPTSGAGGLLVACIICGADPKRIYGIELDPEIAEICRKRLAKYGVPASHIKVGNALDPASYEFEPEPPEADKAVYLEFSKVNDSLCVDCSILEFPSIEKKAISLTLVESSKVNKKDLKKLHLILDRTIGSHYVMSKNVQSASENVLNRLFSKAGLQAIALSKYVKISMSTLRKKANGIKTYAELQG